MQPERAEEHARTQQVELRLRALVHPSEEAILLKRSLKELELPSSAVGVLHALRAVDVANLEQLLPKLGCLCTRLDGRVFRELALVPRTHQRIH